MNFESISNNKKYNYEKLLIIFENKKYNFECFVQFLKSKLYDELNDKSTFSSDNKKRLLFTIFIDDNIYQGITFAETFNDNCLHLDNANDRTIPRSFGCIENMKIYFSNQFHDKCRHKILVIMTRY